MHYRRTASQERPDERTHMTLLNRGDRFPSIELKVAGAGVPTIELPGRLAGDYGIVLFYRGSWCPYCKEQLRAFQRAKDKLADVEARGPRRVGRR